MFGFGQEHAEFTVRLKNPPLPWLYVAIILSLIVLFDVLPFIEELMRGLERREETSVSN
jgi:hypothetical protein